MWQDMSEHVQRCTIQPLCNLPGRQMGHDGDGNSDECCAFQL
jgi:hypothetical protein